MKSSGKECVTIRSALAVVSAHLPSEEHDVLRTWLRVGPAVSEQLCSRQPWRSEQQSEDILALRGKLVQESKTFEIVKNCVWDDFFCEKIIPYTIFYNLSSSS